MDYEDMDAKLKANKIHVAVFCSPHNPCGRVWEKWEIEKAMEVYKANDCVVISDEIWSDLILPGNHHTPTQSVSEDARNRTIAFYAPSKTFNLAGLVGSYHIVYNQYLRDRLISKAEKTEYNSMNVLSMHALIGAYRPEGYEWVDELCQVIDGNMEFACNYIREHFEGVRVSRPQGTYMLFVDFEGWCQKTGRSMDQLIKAGWQTLPWRVQHPHQPGPAPYESAGSLWPPEQIRHQRIKKTKRKTDWNTKIQPVFFCLHFSSSRYTIQQISISTQLK